MIMFFFLISDKDECLGPSVCGDNEKCNNLPGSYNCSCRAGHARENATTPCTGKQPVRLSVVISSLCFMARVELVHSQPQLL